MERRISCIDIAKGIGILLVYIGHCDLDYKSSLFLWIYSFHMPLFFFISGSLFTPPNCENCKNNVYKPIYLYIARKSVSLLFPYLFFSILYTILYLICSNMPISNWLLFGWGKNPLWFIPILFFIECLHAFLCSKNRLLIILSSSVLLVLFLYKVETNAWLPYCISEIPWFYICFATGFLLKRPVQTMRPNAIATIVIFTLHIVFLFYIIIPYNSNYRQQDNDFLSYVFRILIGLLGTIGILSLSKLCDSIQSTAWLKWIGKNTLVILCTHYMYIKMLQSLGFHSSSYFIAWLFIIPSIILYNKYISSFIKSIKKKWL